MISHYNFINYLSFILSDLGKHLLLTIKICLQILGKRVQEDLLEIVVLGKDPADETDEFVGILQGVTAGVDQTDLVRQLKHVLGALVNEDHVSVHL